MHNVKLVGGRGLDGETVVSWPVFLCTVPHFVFLIQCFCLHYLFYTLSTVGKYYQSFSQDYSVFKTSCLVISFC